MKKQSKHPSPGFDFLSAEDKKKVSLMVKIGDMLEGVPNGDVLFILSSLIGSCISRIDKGYWPDFIKKCDEDIIKAIEFFSKKVKS